MENRTSIGKNAAEVGELSYKAVLESNLDGVKGSDDGEEKAVTVEVETPAVDVEDSVVIGDGNVEVIGSLENGEENAELDSEIQKFEELIAAPRGVGDSAVKAESLVSEEYSGETQIAESPTVTRDGKNRFLNESNGEDSRVDHVEIFESFSTDDEAGDLNDVDEVNEKLDTSIQKAEDGVTHNESSVAAEEAEIVIAETERESILEMPESPKTQKLSGPDTDIPERAEIADVIEVKGGDIGCTKPVNGVLDHENTRITEDETIEEHPDRTSSEVENSSESKLHEDGTRLDSHSNGDGMHNDEKEVNEATAIKGSGHQEETFGNSSLNDYAEPKEDQLGEQEELSSISGANIKDDVENEPKELDSGVIPHEVDSQVFDKEENMGIEDSDTSATDHAKELDGLETNLPPAVEDGTTNLETEQVEKAHLSSSELLEDSLRSSQPRSVDVGTEILEVVSEGPEKDSVRDEMAEQNVAQNLKQEDGSSTDILKSSGDSSTSVTYPVALEHASKVQVPVYQDKSVTEEQEKTPAANTSSSANSVARPAGLGLTTPLLESAPQSTSASKVSGSRAAKDIPSTTVTPAAAPARPAGLGNAAPLLEPTSRVAQQPRVNGAASPHNQLVEDQANGESEEYDETREKLQMIRVKFLRLAHRLGQTPHNVVVAQVLYRLGLAEQLRGRSGGRVGAFSFDRASAMAEQLEAAGQEPLDFTCTIMVLGKSGVGKSATINSIFDEVKFGTDAFQLGTKKVQDIVGTVQGIRVRVIDTPGLLPSWSDQRQNEKILLSVKKFIKKTPPDIILYLDRLDMQSRDFGDMPLLRTITDIFGPSIWFNAIVVLTHAASAPPEGPNGTVTSYDMFVTQRSHVVQQAIRQAAGDMRLMNPVSLVENHSACRTNRAGQRVLPNGQVWKPHLLLLSFASKILAEANTLLKLQDTPAGRPFAPRTRSPPLPFLLSSLLQSRPEVKLPSEQFGDDEDTIDDDQDECSDSEDEADYDELPPFKSLSKAQLEKLSKAQRKNYYDELEYREKLLMKKQLKEEKRRRKMMKKMQEAAKNLPVDYSENAEEDTSGAASVPVPIPDMTLPASFDSDNPTHRYRSLDSSNPWLVRAVLEPNGWDHDIGYDGINLERLFVVKDKVPISFSGHVSKDKKDANLQMEIASSIKHGKGKATSLGFDMQSVGKDMAYTLRSETRLSNHRINKASAGFSATLLGDVLTGGVKLEDKLVVGKRGQIVVSGGAIYGRGDVAYGGSLEATLRDKDHPLGRFLSTLGVSVMDWHGDLAIGCNSQTQIPVGRHTNLVGRFNINNKGSGQVSIRLNSSEQLQIVLLGLIPLVQKLIG